MNDFELRALYDRLVAERATGRAACVPPDALMRLAAGDASEEERLTWAEHVAGCRPCRGELALAQAVAEAGRALAGRRPAFRWLALAASILLVVSGVTLWQAGVLARRDITRGPAEPVTLVTPRGAVPAADALRLAWRAVPRAVGYHVEVTDASGGLAFSTTTIDTAIALPASVTLAPGSEYRWRVTADLSDGSRISSTAQAFRVRAP
jgi:hypothetical protein